MISADDALKHVLKHTRPLSGGQVVPIETACGRILLEDIVADRDIPPFDRVCMDGYACRHDTVVLNRPLSISSEVRAGYHTKETVALGELARVMTGAPLPPGTDTVIPQEFTTISDDAVLVLELPAPKRHVAFRGSDRRAGDLLLAAGSVVTPTAVAVLATVGRTTIEVVRRPTIAIVSTGDEIVPPDVTPGPWQIRDSNSYSLAAQARLAGFDQITMYCAPDSVDDLSSTLGLALASDVVIISGGVSLGQFDLVPEVLVHLGVATHFHEVAQKPGKPLWFGSTATCLVFGAPGNPLATVLTFDRYILPALRAMSGLPTRRAQFIGRLTRPSRAKPGNRETFVFAEARTDPSGVLEVTPLTRTGAADVFGTAGANAIFRLSPGTQLETGCDVPFTLIGIFEGAF